MTIFVCGNSTTRNKPCKHCKHFMLWGISTGYCFKKKDNLSCNNHCKYYKRDSSFWNISGKCKIDENVLYM